MRKCKSILVEIGGLGNIFDVASATTYREEHDTGGSESVGITTTAASRDIPDGHAHNASKEGGDEAVYEIDRGFTLEPS